eukprot:CAMPEP_0168735848 /NCGR_PEP_ID=MMETSP0724-20121128/9552_1 /TAXON_ID=265536 /ORGANISM="Amphiprora sp., Strain CCMP467" /LENGTH=317 /DNA_ID=CAMNT_0008783019 /DNA_START=53 /DNA_END=1003 /DNA_ORIENTATION=-
MDQSFFCLEGLAPLDAIQSSSSCPKKQVQFSESVQQIDPLGHGSNKGNRNDKNEVAWYTEKELQFFRVQYWELVRHTMTLMKQEEHAVQRQRQRRRPLTNRTLSDLLRTVMRRHNDDDDDDKDIQALDQLTKFYSREQGMEEYDDNDDEGESIIGLESHLIPTLAHQRRGRREQYVKALFAAQNDFWKSQETTDQELYRLSVEMSRPSVLLALQLAGAQRDALVLQEAREEEWNNNPNNNDRKEARLRQEEEEQREDTPTSSPPPETTMPVSLHDHDDDDDRRAKHQPTQARSTDTMQKVTKSSKMKWKVIAGRLQK